MFENEKLQHANFTLPKPQVHSSHPFRNQPNHDKLLEYCQRRLWHDKGPRDTRIQRYAQIDRDMAGWMRLDDEDRKRKREHDATGKATAVTSNLPLAYIHIDDMMTYYAETFAPNKGMFYQTASPDNVEDAAQIVALMNNHAIYGGYYRQLLLAIFAILKYNNGGLTSAWATEYGPQLSKNPDGTDAVSQAPVFEGNLIQALDMYNFFFDPSVDPSLLHKDGEWYATAHMRSHYWLKSRCLSGIYYNCEEELADDSCEYVTAAKYYQHPPTYSQIENDDTRKPTNWISVLSGSSGAFTMSEAHEVVHMHIRINPNDFGLIPGNAQQKAARNQYEIWRITILNDEHIIECSFLNNIHGHLPCYVGVSNDDIMGQSAKSPAEILTPLQDFSSFLLNTHVTGTRKNLFGTTFYDPSMVDYEAVPKGEVAARVPVKAAGYGRDIRTMVYHDNHQLDTKQTLQDLQGMVGMIDQFFPTQSLPSQIAGIDRAIDSQVAAVQQGANRRQHKGARLLDDTMMRPLRMGLYYNIIQYQKDATDVQDYFGNTITIDLDKLRTTNLAFIVGQGLKSIDRQHAATQMQGLIFALIQAPAVAQQIDLLKMLGFWLAMMDIDANIDQFKLPPPPPPAQGANPQNPVDPNADPNAPAIQPATNPTAITAPLHGRGASGA